MLILGIDPGCSGALVLMSQDGNVLSYLNMPTIKVGKKSTVNATAIVRWICGVTGVQTYHFTFNIHAFIEQVHAMPGQGVTSMFTFGHAAGKVEGVVEAMGIPWTGVTPQAWKKSAGLIGSDKDAARSRAIMLYPSVDILDQKAKGQAVADALLIARHGRIVIMQGRRDLL